MQYQQIIAKAWGNEIFRNKLIRDPVGTLKAEGVELPPGVDVKVVQETDKLMHFVLPAQPAGGLDKAVDFVIC